MFAVTLTNFLKFTVSEENTVKCLEGSWDIFGNGRTSLLVFGNLCGGGGGGLRRGVWPIKCQG